MNQEELKSYLKDMFENRVNFAKVNKINNLTNTKYMLVSDAASEDVDLLSEVVIEHYNEKFSLNSVDTLMNTRANI